MFKLEQLREFSLKQQPHRHPLRFKLFQHNNSNLTSMRTFLSSDWDRPSEGWIQVWIIQRSLISGQVLIACGDITEFVWLAWKVGRKYSIASRTEFSGYANFHCCLRFFFFFPSTALYCGDQFVMQECGGHKVSLPLRNWKAFSSPTLKAVSPSFTQYHFPQLTPPLSWFKV